MKIKLSVNGSPKEIAELVEQIQTQQKSTKEPKKISFYFGDKKITT